MMESFAIQDGYQRATSCKPRRWLLVALLSTAMAIVLVSLISVSLAKHLQASEGEGPTTASAYPKLSNNTTEAPMALATVTAVSSGMASSTAAKPEIPRNIYFATDQGVSAFSPETHQVRRVVNSSEDLRGITHDSVSNKLYWCSTSTIYRTSNVKTEVETLISTIQYSSMCDLEFDRITGNVYVATLGGYILACHDGATLSFSCFVVLNGLGDATGIALDETEGLMYWTNYDAGSIHKAGMDGSSPVTLVTGMGYPLGLTIDIASRRLYWAERISHKIQSSDLDGRNIQLLIQLPTDSWPWGIAVLDARIYWGNGGNYKLQSVTKDGQDLQTLYTRTDSIRHLTVVPASDPLTNRTNDCAGKTCSTICVLTPSSYRCLD